MCNNVSEDANFKAEITKVGTWITWISDHNGTQAHNNHFFKRALPRLTRAVLNRIYKNPDVDLPLVENFLKRMAIIVLTHAQLDVPQVWEMLQQIFNPNCPFYLTYGQDCVPEPEPVPETAKASDDSGLWMSVGDKINMKVGDTPMKVVVIDFSPYKTEVKINFPDLGATQWLSVDDERLTPIIEDVSAAADNAQMGDAAPDTATPEAADNNAEDAAVADEDTVDSAGKVEEAEPAPVAEWRTQLHTGRMCDAQDSVSVWFQSVVVDEREAKEEGGTREVKLSFLGWSTYYDEWLPITSPRIADLNTRSHGRRGSGKVTVALTEQQLAVNDDDDPEDVVAVVRSWFLRSVLSCSTA